MKKLIVIADWAQDSLTTQEVRSTVEGYLQNPVNPNIHFVSSTNSTFHTAYLVSQLVTVEERFGRPLETVIFQDTDPRLELKEGVEVSKGAELLILRLASGMYVCGPNAGFNFSLIKEKIEEVFIYTDYDTGEQFRSRSLYPRICAHLMEAMQDDLDLEEVSSNIIQELQGYFVAHIDNFQTLKTTISTESLKGKYKYGDTLSIEINNTTQHLKYLNSIFNSDTDELVIFPGSSGSKENPYLEIGNRESYKGVSKNTAIHLFKNPIPGTEIFIK